MVRARAGPRQGESGQAAVEYVALLLLLALIFAAGAVGIGALADAISETIAKRIACALEGKATCSAGAKFKVGKGKAKAFGASKSGIKATIAKHQHLPANLPKNCRVPGGQFGGVEEKKKKGKVVYKCSPQGANLLICADQVTIRALPRSDAAVLTPDRGDTYFHGYTRRGDYVYGVTKIDGQKVRGYVRRSEFMPGTAAKCDAAAAGIGHVGASERKRNRRSLSNKYQSRTWSVSRAGHGTARAHKGHLQHRYGKRRRIERLVSSNVQLRTPNRHDLGAVFNPAKLVIGGIKPLLNAIYPYKSILKGMLIIGRGDGPFTPVVRLIGAAYKYFGVRYAALVGCVVIKGGKQMGPTCAKYKKYL